MTHLITLGQIRAAGPCGIEPGRDGKLTGWCKLLDGLGLPRLGYDRDYTLSLGDVAIINDAQDAIWCAQVIPDRRVMVSLVMPAVKRASAHTDGAWVHDCIAAIERWLAGDDTVDLRAAWAAEAAEAWAAAAAAEAADAAACAASDKDAELARQVRDICTICPPVRVKEADQ